MYCKIFHNEIATVEITYGLYSEYDKTGYNTYKLCDKGAKMLWEKCLSLVNAGIMYWNNKLIIN